MSQTSEVSKPTHYDVLNLQRSSGIEPGRLDAPILKAAYHRALLLHHPDKANTVLALPAEGVTGVVKSEFRSGGQPAYSIDQITTAYRTLANPREHKAYDESLGVPGSLGPVGGMKAEKETHIGVETFDLEDLSYDGEGGIWSRKCRCGNDTGYRMTESDLEREAEHGEIYVGCAGCSLFIKILFSADDG